MTLSKTCSKLWHSFDGVQTACACGVRWLPLPLQGLPSPCLSVLSPVSVFCLYLVLCDLQEQHAAGNKLRYQLHYTLTQT
jgi:hypothetical protein